MSETSKVTAASAWVRAVVGADKLSNFSQLFPDLSELSEMADELTKLQAEYAVLCRT